MLSAYWKVNDGVDKYDCFENVKFKVGSPHCTPFNKNYQNAKFSI